MKLDPHMTEAAIAGFLGEVNPHIFSSAMWMAHEAGKEMSLAGRRAPTACNTSLGMSVKLQLADTGDQVFVVKFQGSNLNEITILG